MPEGFVLSARSLKRLEGIHDHLARVVHRAITVSAVDFAVLEGLRTTERQAELVAAGASQTMDSRHLTGHAVDLGAIVGTEVRWDWALYYTIARAMQEAAEEQETRITWGGCWDRDLTALGDPENGSLAYAGRMRSRGKKPFMDGPHYQLDRTEYPA
jgi:peptidoglycan L-alanyl-D-glutamate endopeptidase CwlK